VQEHAASRAKRAQSSLTADEALGLFLVPLIAGGIILAVYGL
jgi:hypothetical protein